MSIKLENNDEQNQRSRLKEIIQQRIESQSIALSMEKPIEEIAQVNGNKQEQRSRLKEIITQRIKSQSIAQTPFIEEMESDKEEKETETDEGIVGTPEEQKERLIHAYLTMEKDKNEQEELNRRRELIHAYSKRTMDNDKEQTEQDETDTYLRTSMKEEQEPSTWEEYNEEEPSKENDDEGKWMTQFSYPTKEEEDALFIAFMTGTVEDQKTWINAKMNLARATTNEETRRREEEILNRIIPTEIVDLDKAFSEEDKEETDDLSENQPYDLDMDQEEDFTSKDTKIYPFSLPGREKSDEFIDKDQEEEDNQSLESLTISYRNYRGQDKETVNSSSLTTEPDNQLEGARYLTEPDMSWKYNSEHIVDEDQWKENFETNQVLFEPTTIFSCPNSPTISQTMIEEIFQDKQNELRIIVSRDYDIQTKEEDTEDTRSVPRRTRDNDLFTELEGYTSWVTRTECEGLLSPENQLQTDPMKLYGIDICPTPAMITEEKSFLGFGNIDKGFIQDNWTLKEPFEVLLEMDKTFLVKKDEQDDKDMIMLPEDLFLELLDHGFDDEQTVEIDDEQSDPIKSLSVHKPKTLRNHFSKVTAATSVNDVIAVNITNMDPRKWITMARIVNNMINSLSGKGPNIWEDIFEDWRIWIPQLPNKNTALTNHSTLRYSKPIQILNGKQARQSLFLLEQPDRYMTENTDNQNKILLLRETTIKTVDEEVYRSIEDENNQESPVQNVFDTPTKAFSFGIPPGPLLINLLRPVGVGTVVEDHGSTEGVISRIPVISEPYRGETTTIPLGTLNKRYELSDKSTFDQRTHFVLHKYEQLPGLKSIAYTAHYPWKNGTAEHINSETWKSFLSTLIYNTKSRTTRESTQQKLKQRMSKQEGLFEKAKKPSIFQNYHPELSNHWKSYPTFHASILSTSKKNDVLNKSLHMEDDTDDSGKSISPI